MLRTFAIVIAGVGIFASLPLTSTRACDDDRYPCPIRSEALIEETVQAPDQLIPDEPQKRVAQPQKKAKQPASNEKAPAKRDPRAPAAAKVSKPAASRKQAPDAVTQKSPEAAPAVIASPSTNEQALNDESRSGSLLATAGTTWPVSPKTEDAADMWVATSINTADAASNAVQMVDANEVNELDREATLDQLSLVDVGGNAYCWICRICTVVLFENGIPVCSTKRECGLSSREMKRRQ
jgi:hypothetical protein